jgi:hypothetical protein
MFNFLKSLFISDPRKDLEKKISKLYEQSVQLQRNGDLRTYGKVMAEIQNLEEQCLLLENGAENE